MICLTSHPMMAFLCNDSSCAMMVSVEYPASVNSFSRSCRAEHTLAFCAWIAFTASGRMMDRKFKFKSYGQVHKVLKLKIKLKFIHE